MNFEIPEHYRNSCVYLPDYTYQRLVGTSYELCEGYTYKDIWVLIIRMTGSTKSADTHKYSVSVSAYYEAISGTSGYSPNQSVMEWTDKNIFYPLEERVEHLCTTYNLSKALDQAIAIADNYHNKLSLYIQYSK